MGKTAELRNTTALVKAILEENKQGTATASYIFRCLKSWGKTRGLTLIMFPLQSFCLIWQNGASHLLKA